MCGMVGRLLLLFCCHGCQSDTIASALAFHPPEPTYAFLRDEQTGKFRFELKEGVSVKPPLGVEADMVLTSSKTKIPIILIRAAGATKTLLFSHGNATDLGAMFPLLAALAQTLGINVVAYDYTGYGVAEGGRGPSERQVYRDMDAAYDWACATVPVPHPSRDLLLYGQSVGSGPATYMACRGMGKGGKAKAVERPAAGLVLHSPILSGLRVLTDDRLLGCCDIFPNITTVPRVACPVMVIHGLQDEEVPVTHGQRMLQAVPEEHRATPWWVAGRGHNDVLLGNEREYFKRLRDFLKTLAAADADARAPAPALPQAQG